MTTVLVVDDKAENLAYLEALFAGHGYTVTLARHGAEALVLARQARPALIVSDLLMPIMDGYTLLRHWKGDPLLRDIPFVVYTATYTEPEDEKLALDLGADAFILKPAEPGPFMARIREVEARHRDRPAGAPPAAVPVPDDPVLLRAYSEALIRKLEEKTLQLEETNKALQRDIAERERTAAALQDKEREQRALAEALEVERALLAEAQAIAHVGSWETDLATMAVTWSDETFRIFGLAPGAMAPTHQRFLDLVHPEDRARVDEAFVRSATRLGEHTIEHRVILQDGREKVVLERWRIVPDESGRPIRANGTCQDITEQRRAAETVRASEERFREIAETITQVFWISDPQKEVMLYISPAYELIWGQPTEALYRRPSSWFEAIHPDDREAVRQALPRQLSGDYDESYRITRPDGSTRWIRDRAYPIRDAAGIVQRVVGVAEDVTERKAMEDRMLRAQRMESLGTLAGGIAHDLNNVLTPILMSIDLLQHEPAEAVRRETLSLIESSARKGADMIRQVLTFARGVEGRRVPVDVGTVVRDVHRIVNDTFLKSVRVDVEVADGLPTVLGDPTQLGQVLLNLCVNARDAMPEGGTLRLTAALREHGAPGEPPEGPCIVVTVEDSGTGMSDEVLDRIFEPFFTTKEAGQGTGLGLPTSLAIVRSHGGSMQVRSTPGAGSCFTIALPVTPVAVASTGSEGVRGPAAGRGELVLVVDDEPGIRIVTARLLERHGYRVVVADGGDEALARYGELGDQIALVLTDLMMPGMDGAALVRALRALGATAPVVAVTGLSAGAGEEQVEGTAALLAKPYTARELLEAVAKAMGKG